MANFIRYNLRIINADRQEAKIASILLILERRHSEMNRPEVLHRKIKGADLIAALWLIAFVVALPSYTQSIQRIGGTLVVAVPVQEGLVVCSDKRLFNDTTNTFTDTYIKIHQVNSSALFVATHTTGFLDATTGKMAFDIFDITARFVSKSDFKPSPAYWDSLKKEIRDQLLAYLSARKYADWPATDTANNKLLFNLVFYAVDGKTARSYSMSVFYEKAPTPVIYIPNISTEIVKTPKLLGKGKDVIALLARNPKLTSDPSFLRFDQYSFAPGKTSISDAVDFAKKLFLLTNKGLPRAHVSKTYDCALLSYQSGFQWIDDSGRPVVGKR
jgi:hypothetical protein